MTTFGKALKAARKANRVTLRELGDHVNLSIGHLSVSIHAPVRGATRRT